MGVAIMWRPRSSTTSKHADMWELIPWVEKQSPGQFSWEWQGCSGGDCPLSSYVDVFVLLSLILFAVTFVIVLIRLIFRLPRPIAREAVAKNSVLIKPCGYSSKDTIKVPGSRRSLVQTSEVIVSQDSLSAISNASVWMTKAKRWKRQASEAKRLKKMVKLQKEALAQLQDKASKQSLTIKTLRRESEEHIRSREHLNRRQIPGVQREQKEGVIIAEEATALLKQPSKPGVKAAELHQSKTKISSSKIFHPEDSYLKKSGTSLEHTMSMSEVPDRRTVDSVTKPLKENDKNSKPQQPSKLQKLKNRTKKKMEDSMTSDDGAFELVDEDSLTKQQNAHESSAISEQTLEYSEDEYEPTETQLTDPDNTLADCTPLYNGAKLTHGQALLLTTAFILRHRVSGLGMKDLIELVNAIVPHCLPSSKHYWEKHLPASASQVDVHYYCKECMAYLGKDPADQCFRCAAAVDRVQNMRTGKYFLVAPLASQLRALLENEHVYRQLRIRKEHNHKSIMDVCCGKQYSRDDLSNFLLHRENLTLTWFFGGAPGFKSSNYTVWPIFCTVNELPYETRRTNPLLFALWFGVEPVVDTFFDPFIDEMTALSSVGFTWHDRAGKKHFTKAVAVVCSCDATHRAALQCFNPPSCLYGCAFCKNPGTKVSSRRLYPMEEMMPERRTHEDTTRSSKYAVETGRSRQGVKGASAMLRIKHFNIIDGFVVEYMHSALLGVVKQFLALWSDPANQDKSYYLDRYGLERLSERLLAIKPPRDIGFLPRSLDLRHQWKPAELKYFLLLYSPVILQGALPSTHYLHWLLFVNGVHLLMGTAITVEDLEKADLCLLKFVRLVPQLYGVENASYHTHLLTHMATSVENWGPLWATSAFMFKDASQRLLEPFSGTRPTPKRIMKQFLAQRQLRQVADEVMNNSPEDSQTLFRQLMGVIPPVKDIVHLSSICTGIGQATRRTLTVQERVAVEQLLDADLIDREAAYFDRFMVGDKLFTTASYAANMKRDDSLVIMQGRRQLIGRILQCVALTPTCTCTGLCTCPLVCALILRKLRVRKNSQAYDDFVEMDLRGFLLNVIGDGYMFACFPENILEKCIIIEQASNSKYVLRLPVCE